MFSRRRGYLVLVNDIETRLQTLLLLLLLLLLFTRTKHYYYYYYSELYDLFNMEFLDAKTIVEFENVFRGFSTNRHAGEEDVIAAREFLCCLRALGVNTGWWSQYTTFK